MGRSGSRKIEAHGDLLEKIIAANDAAQLQRVSESFAESCGVTNLIVGVVGPDEQGERQISSLVETLPLELTVASLKRRHPNYTPTILELVEGNEAYDSNSPPAKLYREDYERIWEEHRQFARCDYFYTVPVHDQGVTRGWAGYFADRPFESDDTAYALRVLTEAAYQRMVQLSVLTPAHSPLTKRQTDALTYCAQGKSNWEIGEILGISEATAHEHVERAKSRLGVHTRIQAAVIAVQRGWIKP